MVHRVESVESNQIKLGFILFILLFKYKKMPSLNSAIYQINSWTTVSSDLVDTVKDFVKAAIRTNPRDLLEW